MDLGGDSFCLNFPAGELATPSALHVTIHGHVDTMLVNKLVVRISRIFPASRVKSWGKTVQSMHKAMAILNCFVLIRLSKLFHRDHAHSGRTFTFLPVSCFQRH